MKTFFRSQSLLAAAVVLLAAGQNSQAGSIARLVYDGITGATVSTLTNAAIFPDQPTFREQLDDHTPTAAGTPVRGFQSKDNSGANYGSYVRGYLEAPTTGDFVFFVASDDASELWLSTDTSPANRRRLAFESSSGSTLFTGPRLNERQSVAIRLVRGQKYFLELLHKQGTGASGLQVGWQRPDGVQEIIPGRHLAQHPLDPYVGRDEPNLPPTFNEGGLNGGTLPTSVTINEGGDLLLELDVIAAQPTTIEWRRNGVTLSGEDLSFLKLSRVSAAASGQKFQAVIGNSFGQASSEVTTLIVTPDTTPPAVVSVDHRGNPNELTVRFSERVAANTATNLANYEVRPAGGAPLPVQSATLAEDGRTVRVAGAFDFVVGGQYQLVVKNLADEAANPNPLSPNPTTLPVSFTGEFIGPVTFDPAHPLQNLAALENRTARFEARLRGALPWSYQWRHRGQTIPGATNAVLEVSANAATAGEYQVEGRNEFSNATSPAVQLTVIPDTEPARLERLRGLAGVNTVQLAFDEPLAPASATNVLNYHVGTVDVIQATLGADGRTVTLQTTPLVRGKSYLVAVINLRDASVAGNPANANGSFVAEVDYSGEILADAPVRYWRFNEATGTTVASLAKSLDTLAGAAGTLVNSPKTGVTGLLPGDPADRAIEFTAASSQRVTVPNGSDLNATAGPWAKRTIELWFRAASVPAPDATGLAATAALWEEGAAARNIAVYLWRDPANPDPAQAELIFHALNNATDGPGAPFGLTTQPAALARHTVTVGETYHVVAVLDGDKTGFTGSLVLYVNGTEVSRTGGIGQVYNHTGDVQIGRGNGLIHTGENGDLGFFDGVIDEVAVYNLALSAARVTAHYQAGQGGGGANGQAPALAQIETRGNPNRVLATFTRPLAGAVATNLGNYVLQTSAGTPLPIAGAVLLPGELTVQLDGAFGFQAGATYTLTVRDLTDRVEPPLVLSPNPTQADFQFLTGGAVGIGSASELASRRVLENETVRLVVVPTGSAPFAYQWFRNGGPLAGETGPQLSVTVTAATVGEYTVEVRNDFSVATSPPATLSLDVD